MVFVSHALSYAICAQPVNKDNVNTKITIIVVCFFILITPVLKYISSFISNHRGYRALIFSTIFFQKLDYLRMALLFSNAQRRVILPVQMCLGIYIGPGLQQQLDGFSMA